MKLEELKNIISRYTAAALLEKGGTRALVVERGARILGLYVNGVNLLWANPDLQLVLEKGSWNVGGLRLW
ncbi:MAG: hypothetical protein QXT37_05500, partial [Thermofilaceae archaeon]